MKCAKYRVQHTHPAPQSTFSAPCYPFELVIFAMAPVADASPTDTTKPLSTSSIFNLIHDLHQTITASIDTNLSWDQLNSPAINYTLVRPIIDRLLPDNDTNGAAPKRTKSASGLLDVPGDQEASIGSPAKLETCLGAVLFALMANRYVDPHFSEADGRMHFISLGDGDLSYAPLQSTRAAFCELLASESRSVVKHVKRSPISQGHPQDSASGRRGAVRGRARPWILRI